MGETLEFLRNPRVFFERRKRRFGSIFTTRVLGMRLVSLMGAEANRWIFSNEGKVLRNHWTYTIGKLLGADSVSQLVGDAHRARRRILAPHFRRSGMGPQVESIVSVTSEHLRRWAALPGDAPAVGRLKPMAFEIAVRYIFGDLGSFDLPRVGREFDQWVQGMFVALPIRLPVTTFGRAMEARDRMWAAIEAEVERRAASPTRGPDVLSTLLDVRDEQGQPLPRSTIVDEIQLMLFAGHDTTVTAMTNILLHLTHNPTALARARAEQDAASGALDLESVRAMPYLEAVILESMRMIPPVVGTFREVVRDVDYDGFRLRKGWAVSVNPAGVHHDATLWTDPEHFDPERWLPERAEQDGHPFAFIPFGGGPRRCLGEHFAMLEMQLVLALMLRGYEWSVSPGQDLRHRWLPFPRPRDGLRLRLRARR